MGDMTDKTREALETLADYIGNTTDREDVHAALDALTRRIEVLERVAATATTLRAVDVGFLVTDMKAGRRYHAAFNAMGDALDALDAMEETDR